MMNFRRKRRSGLTLVEVVVAMSISLLAITSIISVFVASTKMTVESMLQNKAAMEARSVIDQLTGDARAAIALDSSASGFTAGTNTLILRLPSVDATGFALDPTSRFDRIVYHPAPNSANRLARTVIADAGSSRVSGTSVVGESVTPGIYSVQPDAVGSFVIYYSFRSIHKHGSKVVEIPAAGSVQLRNFVLGSAT